MKFKGSNLLRLRASVLDCKWTLPSYFETNEKMKVDPKKALAKVDVKKALAKVDVKKAMSKIDVDALICNDEAKRFSIKTDKKRLSARCGVSVALWAVGSYVVYLIAFFVIAAVIGIIFWDKETGFAWAEAAFVFVPLATVFGFGKPLVEEWMRRRDEQQRLEEECRHLSGLITDSQGKFDQLSRITEHAFLSVGDAKRDWDEKVYGTFWDSVEAATKRFKEYEDNMKFIEKSASDYKGRVKKNSLSVPKFELEIHEFPDIRNSVMILAGVVRAAQKDFKMVTLYEQRKTQMILKEGFANMASAIRHMEGVLSQKIDSLSETLGKKLDIIAANSLAQTEELKHLNKSVLGVQHEVRKTQFGPQKS